MQVPARHVEHTLDVAIEHPHCAAASHQNRTVILHDQNAGCRVFLLLASILSEATRRAPFGYPEIMGDGG
jgi:hypothetical protein